MRRNVPLAQLSTLFGTILLFVLILYGSYYISKKVAKISARDNQSKYMKLQDRIMIGQNKYISIISIGERYFVIGSSDNGMNLITELDQDDLQELKQTGYSISEHLNFQDILKNLGRNKNTKI